MKKTLIFLLVLQLLIPLNEVLGKTNDTSREVRAADLKITPRLCKGAVLPSYIPKVNVVTGEYIEDEEDLVVAGSEPISLRRFYHHFSSHDFRYGTWKLNPETGLIANFGWEEESRFASVGEKNGSVVHLNVCKDESPEKILCFALSQLHAAGQATVNLKSLENLTNLKVAVWKSDCEGDKFAWKGLIQDGFGNVREFCSALHEWHTKKTVPLDPPSWKGDFSPDFWIPYFIPVVKEVLPSGNILHYEFTKWREDKYFPGPLLLSSIKAYNQSGKVLLGQIDIAYEKYKWRYEEELTKGSQGTSVKYKEMIDEVASFKVVGSDKRSVAFFNTQRSHADLPICLREVNKPQNRTKYGYSKAFLIEVDKGNGRVLRTEYDPATNKVCAQYAPVGIIGEMHPIYRFAYHTNATTVYDAENNATIYRFDNEQRITSVEKYIDNALYSVERNIWDEKGFLEAICLEDANSHIFHKKAFKYDSRGNILEVTTSGLGGETDTISYTYSKDNENFTVKLSQKEGTKVTRYSYKPNTNLLISELVYEKDRILKRAFFEYDDSAICVKKIVDDGSSLDAADLKGVTYRKVTYIKPKSRFPCFGLPEIVEENTLDEFGNEILLHKVVYTYHPSGKIEREDHYDQENVFRYRILNEYDDKERLKRTVNPLNEQTTFVYDVNNNVVFQDGPQGQIRREYDMADRTICEKMGEKVERKIYDKLGRIIEEIDCVQHSTKYCYDALGRVVQIVHPDGGVINKEYDILGNLIKETDQKGYATIKGYNFRGQVTHACYPDGSSEHFAYNANGTLKEFTDKNGAKTIYTYDAFDNPTKVELFVNGKLFRQTSATYSAFNKLSETDVDGIVTTYCYDFAGRKISEKRGEVKTYYFYDTLGRVTQKQVGDMVYAEDRDLLGRVIEKRQEDAMGNLTFQEKYVYDGRGNKTHIVTCEGTAKIEYNAENLPVKYVAPEGQVTSFSYCYNGDFTRIISDPLGNVTTEIYDAKKHLKELQIENAKKERIQHKEFVYDAVGNCTSRVEHVYKQGALAYSYARNWEFGPMNQPQKYIDANHQETAYKYDNKGRLKKLIKPDGVELSYSYDDLGRMTHLSSSKKDVDYWYTYDKADRLLSLNGIYRQYDAYGNLIKEKLENGHVLKSVYDEQGRRTQLILPDGTKVDYVYKADQLHEVRFWEMSYIYSERNLAFLPVKMTLPSGLGCIHYEYDPNLRVKKVHAPQFEADYTYDVMGNLIRVLSSDPLGKSESTYVYDDLFQLTQEEGRSYGYDSNYNRISEDESLYKVHPCCQINTNGSNTYAYDANGNLVQSGDTTFTYDSLNRLVKVQKGPMTCEYSYDGLNRLSLKRTPSKSIHFIWDQDKEIGSSNGELRIMGETLPCFIVLDKKAYVPVHDNQGSLVALVDINGSPIETFRYSAFGEERSSSKLSPWKFLSAREDKEAGLLLLGNRYYLPQLGRWLTPNKEEDNPYAYKRNNPLNHDLLVLPEVSVP